MPVVQTTAFAINTEFEVKATGYMGTAAAGESTDIDFAIGAEDRYIHGVRMLLVNHAVGDTVDLHIVDKDGVIPVPYRVAFPDYPVLRKFGFTWNVDHEHSDQGREGFNYVARIPAGTYVRVVYNSTGESDVTVKANFYFHKKVG